jgi:hypothetical protein
MPDVADMMERDGQPLLITINSSLVVTLMNTPPYVPYQAYKVRPCILSYLYS